MSVHRRRAVINPTAVVMLVLCAAAAASRESARGDDVTATESDFIADLDQREFFEPNEFVFKFDEAEAETPGGNLRPSLIDTNPLLGTLPGDGNGQNLVTLEACGVNQPHHHPRGTETSFITKGDLFFGFAEENGGRFVGTNLTRGEAITIPQGLMHFAQNLGCERAQFLANFPTRDPGTQTTASTFFGQLPLFTLRGTLLLDDDKIAEIIESVNGAGNPSIDPECAERCRLAKPWNVLRDTNLSYDA